MWSRVRTPATNESGLACAMTMPSARVLCDVVSIARTLATDIWWGFWGAAGGDLMSQHVTSNGYQLEQGWQALRWLAGMLAVWWGRMAWPEHRRMVHL